MDDLISKQAAIDALRNAEDHAFNSYYKGLVKAHKIIADLPFFQSEYRTGHWTDKYHETFKYYCNLCNSGSDLKTRFCPNCGAKMEEDKGMYPNIGLKYDVAIIRRLGRQMGYGHLMQLASTLWANDLETYGLPRSGARVPSGFPLMTEEGQQLAIHEDNLYRTLIEHAEEGE